MHSFLSQLTADFCRSSSYDCSKCRNSWIFGRRGRHKCRHCCWKPIQPRDSAVTDMADVVEWQSTKSKCLIIVSGIAFECTNLLNSTKLTNVQPTNKDSRSRYEQRMIIASDDALHAFNVDVSFIECNFFKRKCRVDIPHSQLEMFV